MRTSRLRRGVLRWPPRIQYDVFTALRGPDISHSALDTVKRLLTARLRVIVFTKGDSFGGVRAYTPLRESELTELKIALNQRPTGAGHFLSHLHGALAHKLIQRHRLWGGFGTAIFLLLRQARS